MVIKGYTLVQHSGYGYAFKYNFIRAVEERCVSAEQAKQVEKAGGFVFESHRLASEAAFAENYPDPNSMTLIPNARGGFRSNLRVDDLAVYAPPPDRLDTYFNERLARDAERRLAADQSKTKSGRGR